MHFTKTFLALGHSTFAVLCIAVLSFTFTAAAQQSSCTQRDIPVSVLTQEGQPVTGLTAANFTGKFNGQALRITSVTAPKSLPTVLILLDVSGSMETFPRELKGELDLIELLSANLPAGVPIGLTTVGEKVISRVVPTTDRSALTLEIKSLRFAPKAAGPKGSTALRDALFTSVTPIGKLHMGDVIYAITDGRDNASHASARNAQEALLFAQVRVFGALLRHNDGGIQFRPDIIGISGGDAFDVFLSRSGSPTLPEPEGSSLPLSEQSWQFLLAKQAQLIAFQTQEIVNFYDITFDLPAPVDKRRPLQLTLKGMEKDAAMHLFLHYPQQLLPCASSSR